MTKEEFEIQKALGVLDVKVLPSSITGLDRHPMPGDEIHMQAMLYSSDKDGNSVTDTFYISAHVTTDGKLNTAEICDNIERLMFPND